jgi:hypothetical protein
VTSGFGAASSTNPDGPPDRPGNRTGGRALSGPAPRRSLLPFDLASLSLALFLVAASLVIAAAIAVKRAFDVLLRPFRR